MAKGKGGGGNALRISIGLRYDELNQDFVDVEQTISENIQRLNRQNNLIDIRSQISLVGVTDEAKKLDILSSKLREQIELQRNKVILYEDAANQQVKLHGTESKIAQNAVYAYQQQRLALAKLSQQLKEVNAKQNELQSKGSKNKWLAGYTELKGDVSGAVGRLTNAFSGLKAASQSADGAITKSLDIIGSIPHPAGKAVAALAAIPLVVKGIENSLLDMARPAIAAGDAVYVMSRGMQISTKDMAQLSMVSQVTGIEIGEVGSALRRLSASITKADEKGNLASRTLQKYGAAIKDANGNIKQGTALVGELAKAFANARALGKGAEFRDAVGGRFWSGDFVTFLEDYAGNIELAGKVIRNGLANPQLAHATQGEINALNAQVKQLESAFSSAFMPVANHIVPHLRQRLGELTQVINDHSEGIKNAGYRIGEVVEKVSEFTTNVIKAGVAVADFFSKTETPPDSAVVDKYLDENNKEFNDLRKKLDEYSKLQLKIDELRSKANEAKSSGKNNDLEILNAQIEELTTKAGQAKYAIRGIVQDKQFASLPQSIQDLMRYNKTVGYYGSLEIKNVANSTRITNQLIEQNTKNLKESVTAAKEKAKADKDAAKAAQELSDSQSPERIKQYADELSKIKLDLKFGDNNYQKALEELENWYKAAINTARNNWEERIKIEELYKAKLAKLQQEPAKRVSDLTQEAANIEFERTHTAFEKQLRDIKLWREAQLKKANTAKEVSAVIANAAQKEAQAFEKEMDRIRGKVQTLQEKIFEQEHSERANKAMQLQKERAEMYEEGIYDPEDIERYYRNAARKENVGEWANIDLYGQVKNQTDKKMKRFDDTQNVQSPTTPKQQENISTPDFKSLTQDFQKNLAAPIQIVSDSAKSLNFSIGNVGNSFDFVGNAAMSLAGTFQEVNKKIGELNFNIPDKNSETKNPQQTKTLPNSIPVKTLQPDIPTQPITPPEKPKTNDDMAGKIKNAADKIAGNKVGELTQNLSKDFSAISQKLAELTKTVGSIAQEVTKKNTQPPQINVNPTISLNLSGSYVLTQEMVNQLAYDCTTEVANGVTDAVTKALNNIRI